MKQAIVTIVFGLAAALAAGPAVARGPMVCLAPSLPGDAAMPLQDVGKLEFYSDEGDPLKSFSEPFERILTALDAEGHTRNSYGVSGGKDSGATIVFSGATPLSFTIVDIAKVFTSLERNEEETAFMADAVPGITCYSVTVESIPF